MTEKSFHVVLGDSDIRESNTVSTTLVGLLPTAAPFIAGEAEWTLLVSWRALAKDYGTPPGS
ncbi:MAG TPA: hypothetical protein VK709_13420 [Candidatus Saccharimonadales bacterium]|nr:hypothetical protein [Candidatus Saccharimonadales bacterium]